MEGLKCEPLKVNSYVLLHTSYILLRIYPFPLFLVSNGCAQKCMHKSWWKILCVVLLFYTFIAGFLMDVPRLPALSETIRNLYFHVCMWFCMMILFTASVVYAIRYLRTNKLVDDIYSRQ